MPASEVWKKLQAAEATWKDTGNADLVISYILPVLHEVAKSLEELEESTRKH
jgi:hypothetical protein